MIYPGFLTDVEGIELGHAQIEDGPTGVSVIISREGCVCGVDVKGSAPGTRETDLLKPENLVDRVNGVILSGGSAYGLDSATGVMKYLEEQGIGMDVTVGIVPIVTGAVIFDLAVGNPKIRPTAELGYEACKNATSNDKSMGFVGGGCGASVGKIMGNDFSMSSGLGQASIKSGDLVVSAITILNAFGDITDYERKEKIAGVYSKEDKKFLDTLEIFKEKTAEYNAFNRVTNTTISLVATNALLTKSEANKIAQMAHDGYARSIEPVHTMFDGDTIFAMGTGKVKSDVSLIGSLAARVISRSIANAIYTSKSKCNMPSYNDIKEFL